MAAFEQDPDIFSSIFSLPQEELGVHGHQYIQLLLGLLRPHLQHSGLQLEPVPGGCQGLWLKMSGTKTWEKFTPAFILKLGF